jgi:hypothetical protein
MALLGFENVRGPVGSQITAGFQHPLEYFDAARHLPVRVKLGNFNGCKIINSSGGNTHLQGHLLVILWYLVTWDRKHINLISVCMYSGQQLRSYLKEK